MFSYTSQASVCCCSILRFTLRALLFQSCHSPFIHLSLRRGTRDLRGYLAHCWTMTSLVQKRAIITVIYRFRTNYTVACLCLSETRPTLDILSLLHWLTPLLTQTTHSTARFRACWTSSKDGTMTTLGMERVMFAMKMACWLLLLPLPAGSPSAIQVENSNTKKNT